MKQRFFSRHCSRKASWRAYMNSIILSLSRNVAGSSQGTHIAASDQIEAMMMMMQLVRKVLICAAVDLHSSLLD